MKKVKSQPLAQADRFKAMAKELETTDDETAFDAALKKLSKIKESDLKFK